jgi:hypothetical protein
MKNKNKVQDLNKPKTLDKESIYLLQCIDCNCNNCGHFIRDIPKTQALNTNEQIVANKIHYGFCSKLNKEVGEIANFCLLHTQECFEHRNDLKAKKDLERV